MKKKTQHPNQAALAGLRPRCPVCESRWLQYSTKAHVWYCRRCGHYDMRALVESKKLKGGKA